MTPFNFPTTETSLNIGMQVVRAKKLRILGIGAEKLPRAAIYFLVGAQVQVSEQPPMIRLPV